MDVEKKFLEIDLEHEKFQEIKLNDNMVKKFLGGPGFAIHYLLKNKTYELDALHNENILIFMTGLLTGSAYPCSGFFSVSAKSPQTDIYGEGMSGGFFGAELKNSFEGIIFKNKADYPLYLKIEDNNYEFKDASNLWGLDTRKTMEHLKSKLGSGYKLACIGPSGENGVLLSSIINDHYRAVGRSGIGAVMGSKNLKAIAVKSDNRILYHNREKFKQISRKLFEKFKNSPMAQILKNFGTNNIDIFERLWDVPHKNWTLAKWRDVKKISGSVVYEQLHVKNKPCFLCPFACGREIEVKEGPYKIKNAAGAEYETTGAFGSMCLISDVNVIAYLNDLCNRYGVDTISTGCTVAFALDCFENGIINEEDVGFILDWGDSEAIIKLTELICKKEGIGKIFSQGSRKASRILDKGSEAYLAEIKGLEVPMHDPRAIFPLGLQYATSNRGACHLRGFANDLYSGFTGFNEILNISKQEPIRNRSVDDPKFAKDVAITQNLSEINNALGICRQTISSGSQIVENLFDLLTESIYHLTGIKFTLDELLKIGERIFTLKRIFNNKCGVTKKDDNIPRRLKYPLDKGPTKNKVLKIDNMLKEYYKFRNWNENGVPTRDLLEELDISDYK